MRDTLEIGPTPCNEDCQPVGMPTYDPMRAMAECRAFKAQITRALGEPPPGACLTITRNPHDFGTYYEVAVRYEDQDEEATDWAYRVEAEAPEDWDAEARRELGIEVAP